MILRLIEKLLKHLSGPNLITDEGYEILNHPEKRKLLREAIEHYHKTGSWELLDKINEI
jgi:hypothetical protein